MDGVEIDCPLCGQPFIADTPWKKICLKCYLKKKKASGEYTERVKPETKKEYVYVTRDVGAQIEPDMLRRLIHLCHPDKWNNSEASQIATRFLLDLKSKSH